MTEPLFEFLRNPEPLSIPSMLVGDTVFLIVGGLTLFALLALPLGRALGISVGAARWLVHRVMTFGAARPVPEPDRPLRVDGLSLSLARLARQTRTLALELRRRSEEARHWPEDGDALAVSSVQGRWWGSFVSDPFDMRPLLETRRDVWDWLDSVAQLPASDRERLAELGVDPESVREAVTADRSIADCVAALAGLLWSADERLGSVDTCGYRSTSAESTGSLSLGPRPEPEPAPAPEPEPDESDTEARHRRFARLVSTQRHGFSHVAASYAKTSADREDLEQDIALAVWQALPRFRGDSTVETFVARVARYCCYRHLRRRSKLDVSDSDRIAELGDPDTCIESWLAHSDELARVEAARAKLSNTLEQTLGLHLAGLSYAEIAHRLGISEQNVSVRLTRARHQLRAQLAA
jgi:RNA polymerase sigma factor (sigma-70 family)